MNQSGNSRVGKPRRVLIFSLAYLPRFVGGAEVAVKEITDRILPAEFVFEMITLRDGLLPFERIGGVAVYRVVPAILPLSLAKLLFPFLACLKAISLHRRRPYDAIWSIMAAYAGFGGLFFKLINPRLPFLLTLQEGDPIPEIKKKVRFIYPLFRMIFTKADRISAISNYLAEWAMEMGAGATAVTVIPNGVAVAEFKTRNEKVKREEIRKKFNYKEDDIILVTTSRLVLKN